MQIGVIEFAAIRQFGEDDRKFLTVEQLLTAVKKARRRL